MSAVPSPAAPARSRPARWALLLVLIALLGALAWWISQPKIHRYNPVGIMGTQSSLTAVATGWESDKPQRAFAQAEAFFRDVEAHMSSWLDGSEISLFNAAPPGQTVPLSPATLEVLRASREFAQTTQGAFDVTCRPLIELWKKAGKSNRLPTDAEIAQAHDLTGWKHVELLDGGARKLRAGAGVDLGGVAKGFSIDQAAAAMKAAGIQSGIAQVGGDTRCFGRRPDGEAWRIGVRDPFHPDKTFATLKLRDAGVCTSGNYFRFVTIQGKHFSHIVDPRTGWPVDFAPSVTVVAPTATEADAWATGLSVLGAKGLALVGGKTGIEAMLLIGGPDNYQILMTEGFAPLLAEPLPKPPILVKTQTSQGGL